MRQGLKKAVSLANYAQKHVAAYKIFLLKRGIKTKTLNTKGFFKIPLTDKKNYIHQSKLFDLFSDNNFPNTTYASSGSSGKATFWFWDEDHNLAGGKIHEKIFRDTFLIKKNEPTLVIICFSMGVWVAGNYTQSSCRWMSRHGYNLATITPGIERRDTLLILKDLSLKFKNVILAGYPSFVMDILMEAHEKKIRLPVGLKLFTAGDSFSEGWRDAVCAKLGKQTRADSIISIYGSADAGVIGFETPLSIFIRKKAVSDKSLFSDIFGNEQKEPALVQYDPEFTFVESVNNELIFTSNTTIPLVRYNIRDLGQVFEFKDMLKILKKHGLIGEAQKSQFLNWKLPFIVKKGRSDVAVTFYALNIYPEHISAGLSDKKISNLVSGNFRAYNKTSKNHSQEQLFFEIEMAEKKSPSASSLKKISKTITANLLKINTEFRKLHSTIGEKATPRIKLTKKISDLSLPPSKILFSLKGKKPKMVV